MSLPTQDEVGKWVEYNFGPYDKDDYQRKLTIVAGLAEEVGEVMRCVTKAEQGIRGSWGQWMQDLEAELADVYIKLVDVANCYDIDLETSIARRWRSVSERDWVKYPKNGRSG